MYGKVEPQFIRTNQPYFLKPMEQQILKDKMAELMKDCACGSGKKAYLCCKQGEAKTIENETCPCGSGKMVKDCCMANPEAHASM